MGCSPMVANTLSYFSASATAALEVSNCVPTTFSATSASLARRMVASRSSLYATKFVCVCASKYFMLVLAWEEILRLFIRKHCLQYFLARIGHEWLYRLRYPRELFDHIRYHLDAFLLVLFYNLERLVFLNGLVYLRNGAPDIVQDRIQIVLVHRFLDCRRVFEDEHRVGSEYGLVEIRFGELHDARRKIAEPVGKIRVVPFIEFFPRNIRVLKRMHVAQQQVASRVGAVFRNELVGAHHVAETLAHLLTAARYKSVIEHPIGIFDTRGHEHRLPHNRLETYLVFACYLHDLAFRPKLFEFPFRIIRTA